MRKDVVYLLKWAWVAIVVIFIALLVKRKHVEFLEALQQIHIVYLILSFIFILTAKSVLPLFMRYVVQSIGKSMDFWNCFRIYNITQLGKYIPGNIWHFVGKAAAYRDQRFSLGNVRDALIIENVWLVLSAFVYGLILLVVFEYELILTFFSSYIYLVIFFVFLVPLSFFLAQKLLNIDFREIFSHHRLNLRIAAIQIFVWTFLGLGFAVLALPFLPSEANVFMLMGLYAIAFSIGFITPFAPAGIGVREAVLAFGLLPYVPLEVVILISVANRLLYLLAEIILAFVAYFAMNNILKK
jgi:glycosyltransferase 2 family protein